MADYGALLPTRGVVQASTDAPALTSRVREEVLEMAVAAESLGYDAVWVGDSVLAKPRLEPLSTLAAVAGATDSVALGTAVYLPNLRNPINVAHQTATVDQLGGGRLRLGVGVGGGPTVRREHEQMGVPFDRRGAMLDELLEVVSALWSGGSVDHDGDFFSLSGASIGFSPASPPPVYVASKQFDPSEGFPRRIRERLCAHGAGWLPSAPFSPGIDYSPEMYAAGLERARGFVAEAGGDPAGIDPAYYQDVVVADTEAEALATAREFLTTYYASVDDLTDDQLRQRGVFGPPARIRERFDRYAAAGVETFVARFTAPDQREQLRRFAAVFD